MATLISSHDSNGCTGKCDAKCYNATTPECHCICKGLNHGIGLEQAINNTNKLATEWQKEWEENHKNEKVKINQFFTSNLFLL